MRPSLSESALPSERDGRERIADAPVPIRARRIGTTASPHLRISASPHLRKEMRFNRISVTDWAAVGVRHSRLNQCGAMRSMWAASTSEPGSGPGSNLDSEPRVRLDALRRACKPEDSDGLGRTRTDSAPTRTDSLLRVRGRPSPSESVRVRTRSQGRRRPARTRTGRFRAGAERPLGWARSGIGGQTVLTTVQAVV
jgi:hypothetical protein